MGTALIAWQSLCSKIFRVLVCCLLLGSSLFHQRLRQFLSSKHTCSVPKRSGLQPLAILPEGNSLSDNYAESQISHVPRMSGKIGIEAVPNNQKILRTNLDAANGIRGAAISVIIIHDLPSINFTSLPSHLHHPCLRWSPTQVCGSGQERGVLARPPTCVVRGISLLALHHRNVAVQSLIIGMPVRYASSHGFDHVGNTLIIKTQRGSTPESCLIYERPKFLVFPVIRSCFWLNSPSWCPRVSICSGHCAESGESQSSSLLCRMLVHEG